jgi:hypothetical protein
MDILRESVDGLIGWKPDSAVLPDAMDWAGYRQLLQEVADGFRRSGEMS